MNRDGSAVPAQEDLSYDTVDEWYDKAHPEQEEDNYESVYKTGGPKRSQ